MQRIDGRFIYAASDLNNYLECKRVTELEALVARGKLVKPSEEQERARLLRRKGEEHEQRFLEAMSSLHGSGVAIIARPEANLEAFAQAERQTRAAMASGEPIIYQATFFDGRFIGHADFLRRVPTTSDLGPWSYEVLDTKLALSPKPYFLVQLCNYSEHVERLQGISPVHGYIVLGNGMETRYRLDDYAAYYRHLKSAFLAFVEDPARIAQDAPGEYPYKVNHCEVCAWNGACTQQRVDDDHLSLVAWMRRDQIAKFKDAGIDNVAALAKAPDVPPRGMNSETFVKLHRQASLQVRGRENGPIYELLHHAPPMGFSLLPAPAAGDVFFDMEGDPLYEPDRRLEYLFGCWMPDEDPHYRAFWALDPAHEKRTFEAFVDFIVERRRQYPAMHVYHYANYEKEALRRLAQTHCTREDAVDDLLRGEVLVDLFPIVRQALAISEDGYGLKKLERFYPLDRTTAVKKGDESIVMFERWRLQKDQAILDDIQAYNLDDCRSTFMLRKWLYERREEAIASLGLDLPFRRVKSPDEPCHPQFLAGCRKCEARQKQERELLARTDLERSLLDGILPLTEDEYRALPERARVGCLLANLLAYHRREEKPAYWAYFDRRENLDELLDDKEAISGLQLRSDVAPVPVKRSFIYTYRFPDQPYKLGEGDAPHDPKTEPYKTTGVILDVDADRNELKLKWTGSLDGARAITALIPRHPLPTDVQRAALARIAQSYLQGRLLADHPATFDLLAARDPRVTGIPAGADIQPEPVTSAAVSGLVQSLDRSYLFIQGPPGSGKTTLSASIIGDLLQRGKRVGITSTGHQAIHHLLRKIESEMTARGGRFRGLYKHSDDNRGSEYQSQQFVTSTNDNQAFEGSDYDLAAGTSWLFARDQVVGKFDYLFIDEAGQVALADALAVSACAKNVVLLGDPSQLAQVGRGVHPLRAGDSVLAHLLGDAPTVPKPRGVFLDVSYRMQPEICAYVSATTYEGRLRADPLTRLHCITDRGRTRAGLEYLPVEHAGNASSSPEEAATIVGEIRRLLEGTVTDSAPVEKRGIPRPLEERDIIVVTPYNAQRRLIARKLAEAGIDVRVGTVDKFQGQEAAVVFYSMATSSGDDVPRGMSFLFEKNRFNVAVSRARALSILVCSPRLLDIACSTTEQMALANLLCAFAETAQSKDAGRGLAIGGAKPRGVA